VEVIYTKRGFITFVILDGLPARKEKAREINERLGIIPR
jgi:hypothetical protein